MVPIASLNIQSGGLFALCRRLAKGKVSVGVMLRDQAIKALLEGLCEKLRKGNAEQAKMTLGLLDFRRLLRQSVDSTGRLHPSALAVSLGVERVRQTGSHLHLCRLALVQGDVEGAFASAEDALERWSQLRETDQEER
jgi:hypothetical protein